MDLEHQSSSGRGTTVGSYSIVSEIGRGGMGIVLLGHDSRLDRRVAIKALAPEFATDAERLARFAREARTLASLNHPNVAQIYGLEEQDGSRFLVMEYVEGRTLGAMIADGPIDVEEALAIAAQVAAGVEAAHEQGVIHRDLKPGNIVVTPEGRAKVLDFGLAREVEARSSSINLENSPTATLPRHVNTVQGQIIGTVKYMSPEQARGKTLGKRTDVWSFGCVLYEMLSAEPPFGGETASDIIAAILEREPDWSKLPARTPRRVAELLAKCLEKDLGRRLRDIGDARLEIEKASRDREWSTQSLAAAGGPDFMGGRSTRGAVKIAAVSAVVGLGVLGGWWVGRAAPVGGEAGAADAAGSPTPMNAHFSCLTYEAGPETFPSLSPDGRTVLYCSEASGNWDIYRLRAGGTNSINLTADTPEDDTQPAISPDGERIVFRSERGGGGLFVMGATGESPRRLTDFGFNPAWSPDGRRVVFATESIILPTTRLTTSELWTVDVETGERFRITEGDAVQPNWSPGGGRIAYWRTVGESGQRDLFTISASGGEPTALTNDGAMDWSPVWSRDGRHIYFCSDRGGVMGVWRIAVDEATGAALGAPEPVTAGGAASAAHLTISGDGRRLAYSLTSSEASIWRMPFDPAAGEPAGPPERVTRGSFQAALPQISPDGEWVVFHHSANAQEDIATVRLSGADRRLLTSDAARDRAPRWSPDGRSIAFYSDRDGQYALWVMRPDGGGARRVSPAGRRWLLPVWSPDGALIAASYGDSIATLDASKLGEEQAPVELGDDATEREFAWDWSPDGARMICQPRDGRRFKIYVFDTGVFEEHEPGVPIGGAVWLPDSRRALAWNETALFVYDTIERRIVRTTEHGLDDFIGHVDVAPDGSMIAFVRAAVEADIWLIELQ